MKNTTIQTKAAMAIRRERVQELIGEGLGSSYKIADQLVKEGIQCTYATVCRDIKFLEAEWRERRVELRHREKMATVLRAKARQKKLLAEWERSRENKERTRQKEVNPAAAGGQGHADRTELEATTEGRLGDPAYLAEVRQNDQLIAELLGLYDPKKTAATTPDGEQLAEQRITLEILAAADRKLDEWRRGGQVVH